MTREERRSKFTQQQVREYRANRRREAFYAQNVRLGYVNLPGTSGGGGSTATVGNQTPVGGNVFDPNSYLPIQQGPATNPNLPAWAQPTQVQPDPLLAQPLPTGRAFDSQYLNDENLARMRNMQEYMRDPKKFAEEHDQELNQEQSLIDRGMSFLGRIFNYEDEADLQVLGVPLAPVESVWDGFMRKFVGGYDLLNIGFGGLISAMPGGVKTLSYDELSGGHSVYDVLDGKIGLQDNVAPSPMQIAITSVAIEAKRIRDGNARLSDLLLANPATGPFLLAALAAESSPLQQPGFDLMDPEQRKAAFGQGYEQWMSGIGDFALSFADPLIAAGAATKVARLGLLGTRGGKWNAAAIQAAVSRGADEVLQANGFAPYAERELDAMLRPRNPSLALSRRRELYNKAREKQMLEFEIDDTPYQATDYWYAKTGADLDATELPEMVAYQTAKDDLDNGIATQEQIDLVNEVDADFAAFRQANPLENDILPPSPWEQYRAAYPDNADNVDDFWDDLDSFGYDIDVRALKEEYIAGREARVRAPRDENGDYLDPVDATRAEIADEIDNTFDSWIDERVQADMAADQITPGVPALPNRVTKSSDELGLTDPNARLINDLAQVNEAGVPVMSVEQIMKRREIRRLPGKGAIARILHDTDDPYMIGLILQHMHNVGDATAMLQRLSPSLSDELFAWWHDVVQVRRTQNPMAWESAKGMLRDSKANLKYQILSYEAVKKGVTDPAVLASADLKIGNLRATIDQIDALDEVLEGKRIDPLDPADPFYDYDTAVEVIKDLYRRQDVVERALRSEVRGAMRAVDQDSRLILSNNWYSRTVAASRERRALAAYQYAVEGTQFFPKRVLERMEQVDEAGKPLAQPKATYKWDRRWMAPSQFEGVGRIRRAARVWRWFGTETPSGYIGLKGASQLGSENELIAALDLDMYRGEGITVTYLDEAGEVQTKTVGGQARRDEFINLYMQYLSDPRKDPLTALTHIEEQITDDMALAYGYSPQAMRRQMQLADRMRETNIEQVKRFGYFVDPDSNERHYIPYLKTNLANGTYMHNWHAIEETLQRHAIDNYGNEAAKKTRKLIRFGRDVAVNADEIFQQVWRPAVLFRLSYTQRNVFEGMIRAMAYFGSAAPLLWPVQATYHGIEAKVRAGTANRAARRAMKKTAVATEYRSVARTLDDASYEYHRLSTAWRTTVSEDEWETMINNGVIEVGTPLPTGERYFVFDRSDEGPIISAVLTPDEWDAAMTQRGQALIDSRTQLDAGEESFTRAVAGTKFGDWRRQNIDDTNKALDELDAQKRILEDQQQLSGGMIPVTDVVDALVANQLRRRILEQRLDMLRYSPMDAAALYREMAGRSRRIGSGMSLGPDGGRYNDGFADEWEQMNRALVSSDMTRKQSLSAASDVFTNIFQRMIIKHNEAIPWGPGTQERWVEGMADVIDRNAYNPLIKVLLDNDYDIDKAIEWMVFTPAGREFAGKMQWLTGTDFKTERTSVQPFGEGATALQGRVYEDLYVTSPQGKRRKVTTRLKAFAEERRNPITGRMDMVEDLEGMYDYAIEVANKLRQQMQDIPAFTRLQQRRAQEVADGLAGRVRTEDVWDIINSLTDAEVKRLGSVQGSMMIEHGTSGFWDMWRGLVDRIFTVIGTIPEDAVVRGPFYNKRFRQVRDDLIEDYWSQNGYTAKDVRNARKAMKSSSGKSMDGTIQHDEFRIRAADLDNIYATAHRQALQDTRDWMYTIERRTKLGKYGEYLFPFISAQQNSMTVAGRLLWRNPWLAPFIADLWRAPSRLGWEDEEGNLKMPMPMEAVRHFLGDKTDIPVIGGILQGNDFITIPKNGLNVFMPDTGFGILPRPTTWVQVGASELMKAGAFPVETPQIFKSVFGEEGGPAAYQTVKDYIFGEQGTMSSKFASLDLLTPPTIKRIIESKDEMSAQYGYQYALHWATENARYVAGERDDRPTSAEIAERTTNTFWFMAFGNFGIPTPLTPYPILTRPDVQKYTAEFLQERFRAYQSADPANAAANFNRDYGDMLLPLAMSQVSKNVGGAQATGEATSDIRTLDSLIRNVTPELGEDLAMLDILVNNRDTALSFDESAYQWQKATRIPGTNEMWRRQQAPEEAEAERQRQAGWVEYQKFMDRLDAQLYSLGLTNYQQSGASLLRQAKERFVLNKSMDPNYAGWWADYQDSGGTKTKKAVMLLEKSVASPEFRDLLIKNGKENLLGAMDEYVYYRRSVVQAVEESGAGWGADENADLRQAWLNIRQKLAARDVRFGEIMNRWLANDEDPQYPGNYLPNPVIEAEMKGQYVG